LWIDVHPEVLGRTQSEAKNRSVKLAVDKNYQPQMYGSGLG
jgi:hypothetical protein